MHKKRKPHQPNSQSNPILNQERIDSTNQLVDSLLYSHKLSAYFSLRDRAITLFDEIDRRNTQGKSIRWPLWKIRVIQSFQEMLGKTLFPPAHPPSEKANQNIDLARTGWPRSGGGHLSELSAGAASFPPPDLAPTQRPKLTQS